jgi:hypothetical protein
MPIWLPCVLQRRFWQLVHGHEADVAPVFEVHGSCWLISHPSSLSGPHSLPRVQPNVPLQRPDCAVLSPAREADDLVREVEQFLALVARRLGAIHQPLLDSAISDG